MRRFLSNLIYACLLLLFILLFLIALTAPLAQANDGTAPVEIEPFGAAALLTAANGERVIIPFETVTTEKTARGTVFWRATIAHSPSGAIVDIVVLVEHCKRNRGTALVVEPGTSNVLGEFNYADGPVSEVTLEVATALTVCVLGEVLDKQQRPKGRTA